MTSRYRLGGNGSGTSSSVEDHVRRELDVEGPGVPDIERRIASLTTRLSVGIFDRAAYFTAREKAFLLPNWIRPGAPAFR